MTRYPLLEAARRVREQEQDEQQERLRRDGIRAAVVKFYHGFETQMADRASATERADLLLDAALDEIVGRGIDSPRAKLVARYIAKARTILNGRDA